MDALALSLKALTDQTASAEWKPSLLAADTAAGRQALQLLVDSGAVLFCHDTVRSQLEEWVETRHPARDLSAAQLTQLVGQHLNGRALERYGTWVYYPWSRRLVHVLPEAEFRELRTSRNRNKITAEEQHQLFSKRVAIVGLSVGQATAVTASMEEVGGQFVLADFDSLSLSNLNRLRAGTHDLGVNKAVLTARVMAELNPYVRVEVFQEGVTDQNLDQVLEGVDLLFEECDDLYVKLRLRERARARRIPVVMETSDRGLIDLERFDLEPSRPFFHGLIEGLDAEKFKASSALEKLPLIVEVLGGVDVSARMAASAIEVKSTLKTWPQLASAVALGGATSTDAGRRILLGQLKTSGRFYVDLDELIADGAARPVVRSEVGRSVSAEAVAEPVLPHVRRSTGEVTEAQVRTLLSYGVMAPSGGNSQPWKFDFRRGRLSCFHEPERSRSFLDYRHLASHIAFGALVENVSLAAEQQGFLTHVERPVSAAGSPLWVLRFEATRERPRDGALFEQIPRRVTNRKPGVRAPFEAAQAEALAKSGQGTVQWLTEAARLDAVANLLGSGDRLRFGSRVMNDELTKEIRWTVDETERTRDGLDVATLEMSNADLVGLRAATSIGVMELVSKFGGGRALEQPSRRAIAGASAVGLLTVKGGHTPTAMFEGGRALQRLWLTATALGLSFQPMTSLVCLFWRLLDGGEGLSEAQAAELKALRGRYVEVFELPEEHGEVMLFRLAHAEAPSARSLRRHVEDTLMQEGR